MAFFETGYVKDAVCVGMGPTSNALYLKHFLGSHDKWETMWGHPAN